VAKRRPIDRWEVAGWALAVILAAGSLAAYLIWNTALLWWIAPLGFLPITFRLMRRAEEKGWTKNQRGDFNTGDDGPWTPPDGL
jgi:hypothetical protein